MTTLKSNMLKKGKKGFTLTELAIVIAVIAILIAVLVPTFTSVITSAKVTAAAEEAKSSITAYSIETLDAVEDGSVIKSGDYYFTVDGGTVSTADGAYSKTADDDAICAYSWTNSENENLPTIYFTTDYVVEHYNLDGLVATAKAATEAAAKASSAQTWTGAVVTVTSSTNTTATYYFTLASNVATAATSKDVTDTGTVTDSATTAGYSVVLHYSA